MSSLRLIVKLCRWDNLIPVLGVYLPCLWGLAWGQYYLKGFDFIKNIIFFAIASFISRTIGCIINDIVDKDIDKYVRRTKNRVLASGELAVWKAYLLAIFLAIIGFYMLFFLSPLAVFFALMGVLMMIIYPFTKRFLKRPQIVLGATFNIGILVAYANVANGVTLSIVLIYFATIYWAIAYDTIYAYQDIEDDIRLNIGSMAITYQANPKYYLKTLYTVMMFLLCIGGFIDSLKPNLLYYLGVLFCIGLMLKVLTNTDLKNPESCAESFKINIIIGFIILGVIYSTR